MYSHMAFMDICPMIVHIYFDFNLLKYVHFSNHASTVRSYSQTAMIGWTAVEHSVSHLLLRPVLDSSLPAQVICSRCPVLDPPTPGWGWSLVERGVYRRLCSSTTTQCVCLYLLVSVRLICSWSLRMFLSISCMFLVVFVLIYLFLYLFTGDFVLFWFR